MTVRRPGHDIPLAILMLAGLAAAAWAGEASEVLHSAAVQARASRPLRADVRIERDGAPPLEAVLLEAGRRRYLETRTGMRALLSPGKVTVVRDGAVARAAPGTALDGSDVLLEDLVPFGSRSLEVPQVSDEGPAGVVITGAPTPPTAYTLLVHTIDPARGVVVKTKYYRDTINNLVKMARFEEFIRLAARWRPATIVVETFRPASGTTRLALRWREAPETPSAAFTPAGLRAPSPIVWP